MTQLSTMPRDLSVHEGIAGSSGYSRAHPVDIDIASTLTHRNRLTCAFRPVLAIPHLLLVGGPAALALSLVWGGDDTSGVNWGASTGALGAVAAVCAVIAWFAIVFGARYPEGLWSLAAFYLRWRVRALAYMTLLRDEYPPFGDATYPAALVLMPPPPPRNRLTVGFRIVLALPHIVALWALGLAWGVVTVVAWLSILISGAFPRPLYHFAVGVLRWSTRVEAYLLLLHDEYPPFSFD